MSNERELLPLARTDALVVKELEGEVLVYDLKRDKAHCLNPTAASVWKHCDGKTTAAEMTRLLERELPTPVDDDVVWLALGQLRKFHLLEKESVSFGMVKVSRRDLVRKYLPAALVLPVILSIPAPTAAQAASGCGVRGSACGGANPPCCPGFTCNPLTGMCQPN